MKMKRLFAIVLSACLLLTCAVPASAARRESASDDRQAVESVQPIVPIPADLLDGMERDLDLGQFFRPISFRDLTVFLQKMKQYYTVFDSSARTLSTAWDLAYMDSACSSASNVGPIGVVPASLNGEEVTLMVLGGTMFVDGQATGVKEDLLSALELSNDYLKNVMALFDAVDENGNPVIPKEKPLIVSGLSLGGMVAQQLLAQRKLISQYDLRAVICFGSPLIAPTGRNQHTKVVRFCDTMDIVPYLGKSSLNTIIRQEIFDKDPTKLVQALDEKEAIVKDGGYKSPISAHALSYVEGACWAGYDVLGVLDGNNQLVMERDMEFFENPSLDK